MTSNLSVAADSSHVGRPGSIAVVVLTYNEEPNIAQALESVSGWADELFVLDSWSTDRTVDIAERYGCHVMRRRFDNYSAQRNHALQSLPIRSEWIFFLDADEWLPAALKDEISRLIASAPPQNGFYVRFRFMWMGRWIRRGYYPSWLLRLARHAKVRCESRTVNEHLVVEGTKGKLRNDLVHENQKGVADWVRKHVDYANREAMELAAIADVPAAGHLTASLFGSQAARKRWLRNRIWNRLPLLVRPFLYFTYRYIVRGGFLDGRAALVYHSLQALWFPLMVDVRYLELGANAVGKARAPVALHAGSEEQL